MTPRKHPLCAGGCGRSVDIHGPHDEMAIRRQVVRATNGRTEVYATNIIGVWHVDCSRTWNPMEDR